MLHQLLSVSYLLVRLTLGQSQASPSVQDVRRDYQNWMEATLVDIPYDECEAECTTNGLCYEAVYWRGYHICDLVTRMGNEIPPSLRSKAVIFTKGHVPTPCDPSRQCTGNQRCNRRVELRYKICRNGCSSPYMSTNDANKQIYRYEGNMFNFGNRVTVYCEHDRTKYHVMTCQEDSIWTPIALQCPKSI